jgi:NAD(P)-dependent dehydrogenase (short-subunit alcohol dehydrogenase family)
MTRFAGKAMVVTGAAQGIGRRVAERAASEGAAVLIVDRSPHRAEVVAAIGAAGGSAHAFDADLEDELGVRLLDRGRPLTLTPAGRHFFEQVSEIMRRLDALRPASRAAAAPLPADGPGGRPRPDRPRPSRSPPSATAGSTSPSA